MAADFNKPVTTDAYATVLTELRDTASALALALDPALVTPSNTPTSAVRWNSASNKWEKFNGTTWIDLSSAYAITVANLMGGGAGTVPYQTAAGTTAQLAAGVAGKVLTSAGAAAPTWAPIFPVGTALVFAQTAAPTSWTKSTTHNDKALRVVSGTAGSGGSVAFSTAFASKTPTGTIGGTSLSEAQLASHSHTGTVNADGSHSHSVYDPTHAHAVSNLFLGAIDGSPGSGLMTYNNGYASGTWSSGAATGISLYASATHTHTFNFSGAGSSATHTHSFTGDAINLAVQYVDTIIATKD